MSRERVDTGPGWRRGGLLLHLGKGGNPSLRLGNSKKLPSQGRSICAWRWRGSLKKRDGRQQQGRGKQAWVGERAVQE